MLCSPCKIIRQTSKLFGGMVERRQRWRVLESVQAAATHKGPSERKGLFLVCLPLSWESWAVSIPVSVSAADQEPMTVDEATRLGEEFGVIVGDVDEDIKKELKARTGAGRRSVRSDRELSRRLCRHQGPIHHQGNRQDRDQKHDRFRESDQARDERM